MESVQGEEKKDAVRRGRLGVVLYSTPSSSLMRLGIELIRAALAQGYDVDAFAWGDAVNATTTASLKATDGSANPAADLAGLLGLHGEGSPRFTLSLCTTCYKTRGIASEQAIPGARMGSMHNLVELFRSCDRTIAMVP